MRPFDTVGSGREKPMRSAALAVGIAALLAPRGVRAQDVDAQALEGAWRVTELVTTEPRGRTLSSPQPGLLLFTGRYYSYMLVTSDEPRPDLPTGVASVEDMLNAWNPFTANAGTFEISGSTMTRHPIVAKNPAAMAPGAFNEYRLRVRADTLWVTSVGTETGPARYPSTAKYVRVR
jgi:hypothetical protein